MSLASLIKNNKLKSDELKFIEHKIEQIIYPNN